MSNQAQKYPDQHSTAHKIPKSSKLKHSTSSDLSQRRYSLDCQTSKMENAQSSAEKDKMTSVDDQSNRRRLHIKRADSMQSMRSQSSSSSKMDNLFNQNSLKGVGEVKNQMIFAKVSKELEVKNDECERLRQQLIEKDDQAQRGQKKRMENKILKGNLNYQESVIKDLQRQLKSEQKMTKQAKNTISPEIQENILVLVRENEELCKQNEDLRKDCLKYQESIKKSKSICNSNCYNNCQKDNQKLSVNREQLSELNRKLDQLSMSQRDAEKTISDYEDKTKYYKNQIQQLQEKENKEREQIKVEMNRLREELEYHAGLELKRQDEIERLIKIIQMKDQIEVEQQRTRNEVEKLHQEIVFKTQQMEEQRVVLQKNEQLVQNKEDLISHLRNLNEQSRKDIEKEMNDEIEKLNREKNLIIQESGRYQEYSDKLESQLITMKEDLKKINSILIEKQQQLLEQQETFREEKNKDFMELQKIQQDLKKEICTLQSEKELLTLEREKYKNEKQTLISENANIQKEYNNIIDQNKQLLNERQDLVLQKQSLQQDMQLLQQEKIQLQSDKQSLQSEKQSLQQEKVTMYTEKTNLIREKQQLVVEKDTLLQEKKTLMSEKEQLQSQKKILSQQNQSITREKMLCSEENKQLLTKRNEDQQKIKKISEELNNLQSENSKLVDESNRLSQRLLPSHNQEQFNSLSSNSSSINVLKSQYEQLIREKQSHLEEKIKEVSKFKQLCDDKEIELNECSQNLKQLKDQYQDQTLNIEKIKQLGQENTQLESKLKSIQESLEIYKKKALLCEDQEQTISNLLMDHQKLQQNYKQLIANSQSVHLSTNFNLYNTNQTEETKTACNSLYSTVSQLQERVKVCEALLEEKKKEMEDFKNISYFPLLEENTNYKQQIAQQKALIQQLENAFLMREKDFQKQIKKMQRSIEKDNKITNPQSNHTHQNQQLLRKNDSSQIIQNSKNQSFAESKNNSNSKEQGIQGFTGHDQAFQQHILKKESSLKQVNNNNTSIRSPDDPNLSNLICKSQYDIQTSEKQDEKEYSTCVNFNDRMIFKKDESADKSYQMNAQAIRGGYSRENSQNKNSDSQIPSYNNIVYNPQERVDNILDIQDYQSQQISKFSRNSSREQITENSNYQPIQQTKMSTLSRNPSSSLISNQDLIKGHNNRSSSRLSTSGSTQLNRRNSQNETIQTSQIPLSYSINNNNSQSQLRLIERIPSNGRLTITNTSRENNLTRQNSNKTLQRSLSTSRSQSRERNLSYISNAQNRNSQDLSTTIQSYKRNSIDLSQQSNQISSNQQSKLNKNPNQNSLVSMLREKVANIQLSNKKQQPPLKQSQQQTTHMSSKQLMMIPKPSQTTLNSQENQSQSLLESTQLYNYSKNNTTEQSNATYHHSNNNRSYFSQGNRTYSTLQDENLPPSHSYHLAPVMKRNSSQKRNEFFIGNSNSGQLRSGEIGNTQYTNVSAFDFSQYMQ